MIGATRNVLIPRVLDVVSTGHWTVEIHAYILRLTYENYMEDYQSNIRNLHNIVVRVNHYKYVDV